MDGCVSMNGRGKLVLASRQNSVRVNCVAQFRRMSRTMLPCRRSYNSTVGQKLTVLHKTVKLNKLQNIRATKYHTNDFLNFCVLKNYAWHIDHQTMISLVHQQCLYLIKRIRLPIRL